MNKFNLHGIILLDKPKNISSNKALAIVKKKLNIKKAGIVGILDPLATGMLLIVLNEATKISQYIENYRKIYEVDMILGATSSSGDCEGLVTTHTSDTSHISFNQIKKVLENHIGMQEQIPPMHSSVKVNGLKLYKLARKGIIIDRKARNINIHNITLNSYIDNKVSITVSCSKGTYIRTLVESIGDELNIGAYSQNIRRIGIGHYTSDMMIPLNELSVINNNIISMSSILVNMNSISINDTDATKIRNGQYVFTKKYENHEELAILNSNKNLIGIGIIKSNYIRLKRLINFE